VKRFLSFYGSGCRLLCIAPAVVIVGDHTGEAPVCANQHELDRRKRRLTG
jgi:hypothetical protein